MRRRHFKTLRPVCPVCRPSAGEFPLQLTSVAREDADHIVEGVLGCSNAACQREFPIIDGIPIIVPTIRSYVRDQLSAIHGRDDLGAVSESILGDCAGPGSPHDALRQHVSSYVWDHYGEFDPSESAEPRPGGIVRLLEYSFAALKLPTPVIDIGCGPGRTTFELAARSGGLVLGVDLHFAMLRVAARALRTGAVRYARRSVGLVYERREFAVPFAAAENVDFWACDALALPFAEGQWPLAVCLNVLDCVAGPAELLAELRRIVRPEGHAVLACPYDWSTGATPVEGWLGGHSQRGPQRGASEPVLRQLLAHGGWEIAAERDGFDWRVRLHDRAAMHYRVHSVHARAVSAPPEPSS